MLTSNQLIIVREILDELKAMRDVEADFMLGDAPRPEKVLAALNGVALSGAITHLYTLLDTAREFDSILRYSRILFGNESQTARFNEATRRELRDRDVVYNERAITKGDFS